MSETLNLNAIRSAKFEAEEEIMAAIMRLKERTGLSAMGLTLEVIRIDSYTNKGEVIYPQKVILDLEPI